MIQIGPKELKLVLNGPKWSKTNSSKWCKTAQFLQNGLKWSKKVQKGPNWSKILKIVQNDLKQLKMVQNVSNG